MTILNDDDLSDLLARTLQSFPGPMMTRDALHQHLFTALRGRVGTGRPSPADMLRGLLRDPHARTATSALTIIGVLRQELIDAARREADPDEAQRLKNLAACLPQWGA